jgi:hypothetical protein
MRGHCSVGLVSRWRGVFFGGGAQSDSPREGVGGWVGGESERVSEKVKWRKRVRERVRE